MLFRKNTQKFTVGVTEKFQKQLGKEILKITQTDLDSKSTGVFVQRMTSDTDELANMFTTGFGRCVGILSSIGTFVSIFVINKTIFVYYLFAAIILTIIHLIKSKKFNKKDKEKRKAQERVTGLTSELIRGTRDVKMLNAKQSFIKALNEAIKDVVFSYEDDIKVLDKLIFKVKANTTVGFVGKSGSGKTTIFSLLCKMYNPASGKILIDNNDISELDEDSIRGNITIIS